MFGCTALSSTEVAPLLYRLDLADPPLALDGQLDQRIVEDRIGRLRGRGGPLGDRLAADPQPLAVDPLELALERALVLRPGDLALCVGPERLEYDPVAHQLPQPGAVAVEPHAQ